MPETRNSYQSQDGWTASPKQASGLKKDPNKRFIDLTKDTDEMPVDEDHYRAPETPKNDLPPPTRRVGRKTSHYPRAQSEQETQKNQKAEPLETTIQQPEPTSQHPQTEEPTTETPEATTENATKPAPEDTPLPADQESEEGEEPRNTSTEAKRAPDDTTSSHAEPAPKRTRIKMLDLLYAKIESLSKRQTAKACRLADIRGKGRERFLQAIQTEINNNLATGAYKILSVTESQKIRKDKEDKIMRSRYVFDKKNLGSYGCGKGDVGGPTS